MSKYVIINEDDGMMLAAISIGINQEWKCMVQEKAWTSNIAEALCFEVAEEAEAVITFISDVMDWELAQQLYVKLLEI